MTTIRRKAGTRVAATRHSTCAGAAPALPEGARTPTATAGSIDPFGSLIPAAPAEVVDRSPATTRKRLTCCMEVFADTTLGALDVQAAVLARNGAPEVARWLREMIVREMARRTGTGLVTFPEPFFADELTLRATLYAVGIVAWSVCRDSSADQPDQRVLEAFWLWTRDLLCGLSIASRAVLH